ncbi:ATP-binding protein [Streptomyces sp. RLB1-33]|uniref:HAMP domain-containing sensor histidine kinase n=1 Tax=Streptomyces mirabilis TaxID=68239 RepID=UPI00143E5B1B|nr:MULTISPECIES: ATP-binding protein [Streptomyces]QIY74326.1 HAMP domain-containing protein [Streptomyces sp. RLB1-33]QUW78708.1 HAMP domain-containing protein [Streptomyces mirabilis]
MTRSGRLPARFQRLPVAARLMLAVALAMSLVLAGAAGLVYWRVEAALDGQLDEDLATYQQSLDRAVGTGAGLPTGPDGSLHQVLAADGRVLRSSDTVRDQLLLTPAEREAVVRGATVRRDIGALLPITDGTLRLRAERVTSDGQTRIVVAAVQRGHRDEALRELLAQLALASGLTLLAASYVGYRTARAALRPVERYRSGAATLANSADGAQDLRLEVPSDRDDEITRLGHTLNRMLDRLAASAAREHQFIADASHELRTPLTLMRAELDVALHRPRTAEELTDTLRSVDTEVRRLITLANALLDLEQLGSGEGIQRAETGLGRLLDDACAPYRTAAERDGRMLTVEHDRATVHVDPRWLEPAIGTLLDNALRHGSGAIRLQAETHDGRLRLSVTDQGPGFPPDFLPYAFDRFSRAEASRTTPGSGLGLALVAAVAASHNGTAHAENTPHGAMVTLDIPC